MLVVFGVAAGAWMGSARLAVGQYYVGPYPPAQQQQDLARPPAGVAGSGYDPFVLNSRTGRFDYAPIPYEADPMGPNYNPMRLNWFSGRWDYQPAPSGEQNITWNTGREVTPLNYLDTRINPSVAPAPLAAPRASDEALSVAATLPPAPRPAAAPARSSAPSTRPTTAPATAANPGAPPPMRVQLAGHWEFDYATGRWVFVLPPG
jgi:hypothetical protein